MSRVFLAEETRLGRQVVIKLLPPEMGAAVNVERFEREIQLAARLQHPHIVPLLTAASSGDLLFYIMPYISGESLRAKLAREGALPVNEAVKILREVVDALAYAHGHGVVHRDIKPDNVLLSTGHAVVTDFGVAKAVSASSGSSSLTSLGVALGTPAYMAPEQAAADPNVDHRADIYAVGALAYEMLTGRTPFVAPTPQAMLAAHITQSPDPITKHRPTVPAAVNTLLMHCLEKHPADRFQTAAELLSQLEVVLTPSGGMSPSTATPAISSGTEEALKQNHPMRVAVSFAAASLATLAMVWFAVHQFGLPYWVFYGAIVLLLIGLPIILLTGHFERSRAQARATGRIVPPSASGVHRLFTWKKAIRGGFLAFAALATIAIIYTAMRLLGIGPVGTLVASGKINQTDKLLVADFENHTTDSGLGASLTEAFRVDLGQTPVVRILTTAQVNEGLQRMQQKAGTLATGALARELATREGAKGVVAGEVSTIGKSYVLVARILNASDGAELLALRETAESDAGIVAALDRLSGKVRERIGESLKTIRGGDPLDQVTTSSLEALRLYTEGSFQNDIGNVDRAIPLLERAVALDSGFAMAWRKLAVVYSNAGAGLDRIMGASTRAYNHRDRLTELERQLTIANYFSMVDWNPARTDEAYRQVLAIYPEEQTATNNLSLSLLQQGRPEEAESLVAKIAMASDHPATHQSQWVISLLQQGRADDARRTIEMLVKRFPTSSYLMGVRAQAIAGLQDLPGAERAYAEYALASTGFNDRTRAANGQAQLFQSEGRLADAERVRRQGNLLNEERGMRSIALRRALDLPVSTIRLLGDTAAALEQLSSILKQYPIDSLAPLDRPSAKLALIYALAGRMAEARKALTRYESDTPEPVRRGEWEWYQVRGWISMLDGNPAEAVKVLVAGRRTRACAGCSLGDEAIARERAGQLDSALAIYAQAAAPGSVWKAARGDPYSLAPSLKRLGELYEEKGDKPKALEYYGRFTEVWKNADVVLQPQVREVKSRMAKLAGEPK
jgi:serine/threonine-protein kinase